MSIAISSFFIATDIIIRFAIEIDFFYAIRFIDAKAEG